MKQKTLLMVFFLTGFLALVSCVSSTKLVERWHDENISGPKLQKVLVLGVFKDDIQRRSFESTFAKLVDAKGKRAVPGYTLMPNPEDFDTKEDILAAVKKVGADSVLITSYKGIIEEKTEVPARVSYRPQHGGRYGPYGSRYGGYYGRTYERVYHSGYTITDKIVQLDTRVYSVKTEKMIWAGKTKSVNASSGKKIVEELVRLVAEDMRKSGLIK